MRRIARALMGSLGTGFRASLNADTLPVNCVLSDPAVNSAAVISNLKTFALNRFDQVQVLKSVYFTKDDVVFLQILHADWNHCAKLTGFNFAGHGITARPKLHGFTLLQFL